MRGMARRLALSTQCDKPCSHDAAWLAKSTQPMQTCLPLRSHKVKRFFCTASLQTSIPAAEVSKVFASFTIYKGKAALSMEPIKPNFKAREDGSMVVDKEGSMFLEFAPSIGTRQYDWSQKQVFALSVTEMGGLLALTMSEDCEFYHDPHMGSSNAGMVRKTLKVEPMPDKTGFFFTITVANKMDNVDAHFTVPVTRGEFAVMRSSFNYLIPYLLGFHALCNPRLVQFGRANGVAKPEDEWLK